jgi:hypothetical protein
MAAPVPNRDHLGNSRLRPKRRVGTTRELPRLRPTPPSIVGPASVRREALDEREGRPRRLVDPTTGQMIE